MSRTFEERASAGLDALYQGALFLSGGHPDEAEELLVAAVSRAFRERQAGAGAEPFERHLEGTLAVVALQAGGRSVTGAHAREGVHPLHAAAATMPMRARAALWLVLLRRWSYADAALEIGVERDRLRDLLAWRERLARALEPTAAEARREA